jgi:hypothetical protein
MVPSMLELIFFYILQKVIQGYLSHFVCARVTVFSGARQQNFAGAGLLCTVRLTSIYNPQIGGKFTETSGGLTNLFYGCKD